jgi:hypothetical protein
MNIKRKNELKEDLYSLMNKEKVDEKTIYSWLFSHLKEYIERFCGFAAIPRIPMENLLRGDVGLCIEIACEIIEEKSHVIDMPKEIKIPWMEISELFKKLKITKKKEMVFDLLKIVDTINVQFNK